MVKLDANAGIKIKQCAGQYWLEKAFQIAKPFMRQGASRFLGVFRFQCQEPPHNCKPCRFRCCRTNAGYSVNVVQDALVNAC